jgi:hypothetical protein
MKTNKFKVGDKALVTGYDSPTAYFRDFQGKVVTVQEVITSDDSRFDFLKIKEFSEIEKYHLVKSKWFKKVD